MIPSYLITNIFLFLLFFNHTSKKSCLYSLTLSVFLSFILQLTSVWSLLPPHQVQLTNVNPHLMCLPSQWYLLMFIYWYLLLYIHSFLYSSLLIDSWRAYYVPGLKIGIEATTVNKSYKVGVGRDSEKTK